ncbi:cupin domain-containing protein [Sphingobium bisphenolivorans]|uniref:cupin domain-containing protein n=1 Tax=Sphingobium bisphenolivorans TaxID=1335760 RepID=UPI0003B65F10|nr:cupin domain-containing protein [Sphingobium bisphenolivorans]
MTEALAVETRSFRDLRAFAEGATIPADAQGDAFLASRATLGLPQGPVSVSLIALPQGRGRVETLPDDEFLILLDGALTLESSDSTTQLTGNQSAVVTRGSGFTWSSRDGARLIAMRRNGSPAAAPAIIPIDESAPLEPSGAPLAELLVGPTPSCRNFTDYRSADTEFVCGTWDSTPYHRRSMPYRHYELMHLLQGSVTFVDGEGREQTFREGDIFLVEQGAHCSWESREHVKKVYAIYRPA